MFDLNLETYAKLAYERYRKSISKGTDRTEWSMLSPENQKAWMDTAYELLKIWERN